MLYYSKDETTLRRPGPVSSFSHKGENWPRTERIRIRWRLNFVFVPLCDSRWWNITKIHILCGVIVGDPVFFKTCRNGKITSRFFLLGLFPRLISTRWLLRDVSPVVLKKLMTVFAFKFGPKRFFTSFLFCF